MIDADSHSLVQRPVQQPATELESMEHSVKGEEPQHSARRHGHFGADTSGIAYKIMADDSNAQLLALLRQRPSIVADMWRGQPANTAQHDEQRTTRQLPAVGSTHGAQAGC